MYPQERKPLTGRLFCGLAGTDPAMMPKELWLIGDVFDYWYEYNKVVPRGFVRFLGKLASLADEGVEIHLFPGNHDVWLFDYLPEEIGVHIHTGITGKNMEQ